MNPAFLPRALIAGLLALVAGLAPARAETLDKVSFGTNWVAEAEHGGFFQAVADGTYKKYGLDVTIVPGGPNTNNRILLVAGKLDFFMTANTLQSFDAVTSRSPSLPSEISRSKNLPLSFLFRARNISHGRVLRSR